MAISGADIDQLRQAATQLDGGANSLESSVKMLTGLITTGTNWLGPDAERFRAQWSGESLPSVNRAVEALRRGSQELRRHAGEQEQASGANGGPGPMANVGTAPSAGSGSIPAGSGSVAAGHVDAAAGSANARESAAFVDKWEGKFIDPDKSYGAQCFDVFRQYSNEVVGARPGIATDSNAAADIYNHYDRNGVADYYERIPYGQGQPQPGDIIVYGGNKYNGNLGHVALVTSVDGNNYSVLEQNYGWQDGISGNDPAAVRQHTFSNKADGPILGYLRPK